MGWFSVLDEETAFGAQSCTLRPKFFHNLCTSAMLTSATVSKKQQQHVDGDPPFVALNFAEVFSSELAIFYVLRT